MRNDVENPAPAAEPVSCWLVSAGMAGMESNGLGLAEALGLAPSVRRIALRPPWRQLSPHLRLGLRWAVSDRGDALRPPWPDLLISVGRRGSVAALAVRRAAAGRTAVVQIQDPGIDPAHFDVVVVPRHDRTRGPNVVTTLGALHRVTPERLRRAAAEAPPRLAALPRPRVAVLVGGGTRAGRPPEGWLPAFATDLRAFAVRHGAGLMVTASRRTGADGPARLRAGLAGAAAEVWDGEGPNPYLAFLALADAIVVTADSVSMASEAAATGRPVYVAPAGPLPARLERFHAALREAGIARPFTGDLATWRYAPPDDAGRAAAEVRRRLPGLFGHR